MSMTKETEIFSCSEKFNKPVDNEALVGSLLVANRTDPGGLLLIHLQIEGSVETLQVRAGDGPTRHSEAHLAQLQEAKRQRHVLRTCRVNCMELDGSVNVFDSSLGAQLTGQMRETRKLVVAISLSGSAVSFSFTGARGTFGKINNIYLYIYI